MTERGAEICGATLHGGVAAGTLLVLQAPLSLWGGSDPKTGRIVDQRHPQHGAKIAGRVLVMHAGRGSSSSSSVLAEQIRLGVSPAAFLLSEVDVIIALGAIVAAELYDKHIPVVMLTRDEVDSLRSDQHAEVTASPDGAATIRLLAHPANSTP